LVLARVEALDFSTSREADQTCEESTMAHAILSLTRLGRFGGCVLVLCTTVGLSAADAPLVEAVKKGDSAAVLLLLRQKVDVNAPEADGTTALHWAVNRDDLATTKLLLGAGANVEAANRYGVTPLSLACVNANPATVEALLAAGANPNTATSEGETPLQTAARTGSAAVVKALLARGADIKAKENWRGQDALMWATAEGHLPVVQALIEHNADVTAASKNGYTALLFAARQGRLAIVETLVATGANVNAAQQQGIAPLTIAIYNSHWDVAAFLLDKGADPNLATAGFTPLHLAIQVRRPELLQFAAPASTSKLDSLDVIKSLLARGADVNARMAKGFINLRTPLDMPLVGATPFFLAAKTADASLMRLLVDAGADPLLATEEKATPLMAAAGVGYRQGESPGSEAEALAAVELAVELGADVNAANAIGFRALHGAAIRGANSVIEYLVGRGARLDAKDRRGRTAFTIAEEGAGDSNQRRQLRSAELLRELMSRSR
jgi:ankyrin repeat protein